MDPRASECLHGAFVVYTKEQKTAVLGVSAEQLQSDGSVSAGVAAQMALGALAHSTADLALSVTGVLGPNSDEDGNPAGSVFLATCRRGQQPSISERHFDDADPDVVRRKVTLHALDC